MRLARDTRCNCTSLMLVPTNTIRCARTEWEHFATFRPSRGQVHYAPFPVEKSASLVKGKDFATVMSNGKTWLRSCQRRTLSCASDKRKYFAALVAKGEHF